MHSPDYRSRLGTTRLSNPDVTSPGLRGTGSGMITTPEPSGEAGPGHGWVQMRCRECAAEVSVTAGVCSGCGASIVGPPPVMADTMTDSVASAVSEATVSDAAGEGRPAGKAGQTLPEPYVPGSGDRLQADLRLVLAGHIGLAAGLFAAALVCAAVTVLFVVVDTDYLGDDLIGQLLGLASILGPLLLGLVLAAYGALELVKARTRFAALLGRPSDPHTATVVALKRGGRTLILDVPWDGAGRGYQPLSEVHLALLMRAGMLEPGETVTVFGEPGGEHPLLISSARRGRAFLGTMKARSTVQPGPVAPLDERVSGATLVDWAAWAASTTFSYTGYGPGCDTAEVDVFRSAVRDTFLGVRDPPVRSDDVRGKQFSTHRLRERL